MPIPKPNQGEKKVGYMGRCMSNDIMMNEYPDKAQRFGVCNSEWNRKKENMEQKKDLKYDEDGHIIIAENVQIVFNAEINPLNSIELNDDE